MSGQLFDDVTNVARTGQPKPISLLHDAVVAMQETFSPGSGRRQIYACKPGQKTLLEIQLDLANRLYYNEYLRPKDERSCEEIIADAQALKNEPDEAIGNGY